ncbi:MAG: hypothetical protein K6B12_07115, partial [Clostridiales bacterium]|nr:hypothetical protein [Clostridiales bacterium]
ATKARFGDFQKRNEITDFFQRFQQAGIRKRANLPVRKRETLKFFGDLIVFCVFTHDSQQ